jgi:hypothetical protein
VEDSTVSETARSTDKTRSSQWTSRQRGTRSPPWRNPLERGDAKEFDLLARTPDASEYRRVRQDLYVGGGSLVKKLALLAAALGTLLLGPSAALADPAIVFDGSPGTAAPPAMLGPYTVSPFAADPSLNSAAVISAPGPTGNVSFSPSLTHCKVPAGCWGSWSNGYAGDVYANFAGNAITMTMPANTGAFRFYAEPADFQAFSITATAQNGTTSGPVTVSGLSGATYFGFYGTGGAQISTITVLTSDNNLAVGEFGIAAAPDATAPTLASSVASNGGAGPVNVGGTDYYRGQVLVTLHATDAGSGIARFTCTIDGSQVRTFIPGQSINGGGPPDVPGAPGSTDVQFAFDFNSPGARSYSCTATDVAGNTSSASAGSFVIDNTAPVTTATTTPASGIATSGVTVNLNASDPSPGVGVQSITYAINSGTPTTVNSASASFTTPSTNGANTITYHATDKIANTETTKTLTVYVDHTKPSQASVDQYFVPVGSSYSGILSGSAHDNLGVKNVKVTLTDAIGTITYTHTFTATCTGCGIPGNQNVTWSVDFSGHLPARGNYIASIKVTDLAGNTSTIDNAAIIVQT